MNSLATLCESVRRQPAAGQTFSYCQSLSHSHSSLCESDNTLNLCDTRWRTHTTCLPHALHVMSRHVTSRHVTGHKSHMTCHMLHVTCHMVKTKYYNFNMARAMQTCCCLLLLFHMSHVTVTCYMSYVTCHMSHITCHMSNVTCHM